MNTPKSIDSDLAARNRLLLERVQALYLKAFANREEARKALAAHGITNLALLEQHGVGYCEGTLPKIMNTVDGLQRLTELGVCDPKGKERFAGCCTFPLHDAQGALVELWAMSLNDLSSKFLNKTTSCMWNQVAARRATQLYVALDPLDGLALRSAQFGNVIAVSPTSTDLNVGVLEQCGVQQFTIVAGDGSAAAIHAVSVALHPYVPSVLTLPKSDGPLAFLKTFGAKALTETIVAGSHGLSSLTFPGMRLRPDGFSLPLRGILYTIVGLERTRRSLRATIRAERAEQATAVTLDFNQLRSRREFIQEVARVFDESSELAEAALRDLQSACDYRIERPDLAEPDALVEPVSEGDRKEAELLGKSPDLFRLVVEDFHTCGLVGEELNIQLCFLTECSRKMSTPLAVMLLSSIGAGKSAAIELAAKLCPPEEQVPTDYLSGKALFHLPRGAIKHKLLAIAEAEGAERANYAIRILLSNRALRSLTTGRDTVTGKLQSEAKLVEGPVAMLITGSDPQINRETLSRFIVSSADETREQTEAIKQRQREDASEAGLERMRAIERIVRRHHAYQRLLENRWVIVPAALAIDYSDDRLCSRRDHPKILGLVRAVAFARQMQKETKLVEGIACIEADNDDLAIALSLARRLFGAALDELSAPSRTLLRQIHELSIGARSAPNVASFNAAGRFTFTRRFLLEQLRWSKTSLHRSLKELEDAEYVVRDASTRQRPWRYFLDWRPAENSTDVPPKFQSPKDGSTGAM